MRNQSSYKKLKKHETIQEINEKFSDIKLANLGITGAGFGISKGSGLSRSNFINQTILIDYLVKVGRIIGEYYRQPAPIIIQVNNLDIHYSFYEDDLIRLFNEIRDTLQIPNISWIICGDTGLGNFLEKNVPRVGQIVNTILTVDPLSLEEILKAFELRIKKANMAGKFPVERSLLKIIYDISNGSFREILNITYQLLVRYYNEPLVTTITGEHARFFFYEIGRRNVEKLKRSNIQYLVFEAVLNNPGINQKKLSKLVNKQQSNVSRVTKELEAPGYITIKKVGRTNYYYPDIKYHIGFSQKLNGAASQ
jgi:hypothetical protein